MRFTFMILYECSLRVKCAVPSQGSTWYTTKVADK